MSRLNNLGFAELEQWRQAEELDIRGDPGFSFMPSCMAHFRVIWKTRLTETDLIHLKQAFTTNPSLSPCTVIADIMPRVPLTTTLKSYIPDDTPDGPARFPIAENSENNLAVVIDIRENGVTVRIETNEAVY
ncbi:hypothetical protein GCK72_021744 [Caenorhabditis remanei]|uniref:DUF38 domain-containing protein n=1 Tax=Caenorhabditis remanei TaxID=31234 RepID=A0A6A5GKW8_CAERE|nr:hypothetical protein GCK72_021744 [Caenorhabditis remanei]KAF1755175.1 hypothetical protein GCK72_021744 [Caenorhabditis remanei]